MNLYEIRDRVFEGGRLVLSIDQLSNLIPAPKAHAKVYANRMIKKGFATRIIEGTIAFTNDTFIIASQLIEPSYISFTSALYLQGIIKQIPTVVECVTPKNSRVFKSPRIEYHKINSELFFGYERMERYGSYVFVARPAKAILDMIYFDLYPRLMKIRLDKDEIKKMAKAYEKIGGYRAGRVIKWVMENAR
ncbi:MAG: hypothetical protein QXX08_11300 [Candidatus Bathyarchaeia archaeon]